MSLRMTSRDSEILDHLSTAVRLFSLDQIAHAWWGDSGDPRKLAEERIRKLARAGWVERYSVLVRPMPKITAPVACWRPGQLAADFGKIALQVQSRWKNGPRKCLVVVASGRTTKSRIGKPARGIRQYFQLTHDLGVAETFLRFKETRPEEATLWKGEGIISPLRRKKKVPDAIIAGDSIWPPRLVVEFAGAYARERIEVFHWFCEKEQLAYELW
ncbi:MAG: hypothetical protein R3C17_08605 [Planctomycetaceae bacterium]